MRHALLALTMALLGGASATTAQIFRIEPADTTTANYFGAALSVDDDVILIGATGRDTCGPNSGAAFVYRMGQAGSWDLEASLVAEDCEPEEYFGRSVAIEGDVAAVTSFVPTPFSRRSNAVYVFERDDMGVWHQTARLTDPVREDDGPFGASVAVDDGRVLVTSAGDTAGGRFGGSATIFRRTRNGRWRPDARLHVPHDARLGVFGTSSALDGSRAVVTGSTYGLNSPGTAHVFEQQGNDWVRTARIDGVDDYFIPIDLDGDRLIIGQTREGHDHTGRAVVYELGDSGWTRMADLKPDSPYPSGGFGSAVALSEDIAAVVGFDEQLKLEFNIDRVVFVFVRNPDGTWTQRQIIDVGEVYFGAAIDLDGKRVVIGKASEDEPGDVYVALVR